MRNRLGHLILLIPYWESHRADPEEKQGPASDIRHRSGKTARKRLTSNRRIEKCPLSRLENAPTIRDAIRLTYALIDQWMQSYATPRDGVVLDIDDTCDVVHGHQQLS